MTFNQESLTSMSKTFVGQLNLELNETGSATISSPHMKLTIWVLARFSKRFKLNRKRNGISKTISERREVVTFASPNEDELVAMANNLSGGNVYCPIERNNSRKKCSTETLFHMLKSAVWVLLEKGIKIVVVTVGSDGVFLCSRGGPSLKQYASNGELFNTVTASCPSNLFSSPPDSERSSFLFAVHFPALPASVVRLTGAGDCLVGGTIASICAGLDVMQSLAVGIAASKAAVEVETNVPSVFNLAAIADDARSVYSAAKVVFHQSMP